MNALSEAVGAHVVEVNGENVEMIVTTATDLNTELQLERPRRYSELMAPSRRPSSFIHVHFLQRSALDATTRELNLLVVRLSQTYLTECISDRCKVKRRE